MFIDINYSKRTQEAKFHLAKPNKTIISHISEKFKHEMSIKLGNINELSFSIPHYIQDDDDDSDSLILNPHVTMIKEKMLIKVTMGAYKEWYVIDEIEEDGEDSDVFNVKAFSLGYELTGKLISGLEEEGINATTLLNKILEQTIWSIGTVDPLFDEMFRSFDSGNDSNVLEAITQAGETYGALIVWDTENRKVSFKDMAQDGKFRGMTVNYGRFLRSIKRTRTTDEMVTRLHVSGSEGLSIHGVNPTGMGYIEDFSYFMYPFQRDVNKNVIQSSFFMTDALCHAILNQQSLLADNSIPIKSLLDDLSAEQGELVTEQTNLTALEGELKTLEGLLDTAKAVLAKLDESSTPPQDIVDAQALVTQRQTDVNNKTAQVTAKKQQIDIIESTIESYQNQLDTIQSDIYNNSGFNQQLLDELNLYIIEKVWSDDRYIDATELYNDAVKRFNEIRQPKVVIEVSIDNIMNIIEEQYYWDKLVLGDLIKVKYPQMNIEYMAKIIEINYDLENKEASITIANTTDLLSDTDKLVQLLYSNSNASTLLQNNKYKWDKINAVQKDVIALLQDEWDANKQKITAGVNNSIEIGNRGIIITNPDFPDEMVIAQSGIIALSKDGGETWKTAIKPDGIVAERLIGKIIAGQELFMTNSAGTFTFDNNGVRIHASAFIIESDSGNLLDRFTGTSDFIDDFTDDGVLTPYEKKMTKYKWDELLARYDSNMAKISYYYPNDTSTAFISNYINAKTALYNYLFVDLVEGKALLGDNNMAYSTRIDIATYQNRFTAYYNAENEVDNKLLLKTKDLLDEVKQVADGAQDNIDEIEDDIVYAIEIYASNGLTFRNNIINTILTAKVKRGKDYITDLPNSAYIWKKKDKDGNFDTTWNNAHVGVGSSITVTGSDVYQRATFECSIDIP